MPKTSSVVPKSCSSELKVSSPIAQKGVKQNRDDEATAGASAGVKKSKFNAPPVADEEISENDVVTDEEELEGDEELSAEMQVLFNVSLMGNTNRKLRKRSTTCRVCLTA